MSGKTSNSSFSPTSHVRRMVSLLVVVTLVALGAQVALRPEGYGDLGPYRGPALYEIASREPVHQGKQACRPCHEEIFGLHSKDVHYGVQCEDCHGPGNQHVSFHLEAESSASEASATMPKEYTLEGCLFCHRKLVSRPRDFPQIDPITHYSFLHVTDPETRCIECHSPHEPIFLLARVSEARIHPIIFECEYCHDSKPAREHSEIPRHPVIFTCRDCHPAVVADYEKRKHSFMRCTACHLFHRENETAGRIFKIGNQRFCLLCHEKKSFKDADEVPQIVSAEHLEEMAELTGMELQQLVGESKTCLRCHIKRIHDKKLFK